MRRMVAAAFVVSVVGTTKKQEVSYGLDDQK
jgi:hypothetical protein